MFFRFNLLLAVFVVFCQFAFAQEVKVTLGKKYELKRTFMDNGAIELDNTLYVSDGFDLKVLSLTSNKVSEHDLKVEKKIDYFVGMVKIQEEIRMFYAFENKSAKQIEIISYLLDTQKKMLTGSYTVHYIVGGSNKLFDSKIVYSPDSSTFAIVGEYYAKGESDGYYYGVLDNELKTLHSGVVSFLENPKFKDFAIKLHWSLNDKGTLICAESLEYSENVTFFVFKKASPAALRYVLLNKETKNAKTQEIAGGGLMHTSFYFQVSEDNNFEIFSIFKNEKEDWGIASTIINGTTGASSVFQTAVVDEGKSLSLSKKDEFISEDFDFKKLGPNYYIYSINYDEEGNAIFMIHQKMIVVVTTTTSVDSKGRTTRSNHTSYYTGNYVVVKTNATYSDVDWAAILQKRTPTTYQTFDPIVLINQSTLAVVYDPQYQLKQEKANNNSKETVRVWYVNLEDGASKSEQLDYNLELKTTVINSTQKQVLDEEIRVVITSYALSGFSSFYFAKLELVE